MAYNTLIMGASYGSLLAIKLLLAGHSAKLICLPEEAELINTEGQLVRIPVRGREGLVEVHSNDLPGTISAAGPGDVDPSEYDLIALAMQEPQYRSPGVRELLDARPDPVGRRPRRGRFGAARSALRVELTARIA